MTDREFFETLRQRGQDLAEQAVRSLKVRDDNTRGTMSAHVARERVMKLRRLARQLNALADAAEVLL